ncbi:glycosyltransferase family 1 protein [Pseudothauera nasutitermitis]|uniref:Glycosyltransferase family 1 protein n=1 Tax=Pseudothauera nasutitermitis TaxID=2565930 RepID=A0A4S4B111_9RHOO|nr:glycosyltransferase family 1 protein [Pseudothauera nasutitermitis]THF66241.1 glycosyltransferase family 1 protein [Pseudothauera nasutitermitis]
MARVLIAWELGGAFGHLARCLRLAQALRLRGHDVVLALRDVRIPTVSAPLPGITIVAAPFAPAERAPARPPVNYAEVLTHCGFAKAEDVAARLVAWQGLMALARPDVVVADHAPTALLAARTGGLPHLAVGTGFAIPPVASPWPSIRPWESIPDTALIEAETRLDAVVAGALSMSGYAQTVRMRTLFGAQDVLDTFVELDHYGGRANACYVGPIGSLSAARRVNWATEGMGCSRVLAYMRPEIPGSMAIMRALARLDAEVLCIVPGLAAGMARRMATQRLRIALTPIAVLPLLKQADLAVCYGNSGFVSESLLAGVPLLLRPWHVEQALLARRVEVLGAGRSIDGQATPEAVLDDLEDLMESPKYRHAAQAFRGRYRGFSADRSVEGVMAAIERRLLDQPVPPAVLETAPIF